MIMLPNLDNRRRNIKTTTRKNAETVNIKCLLLLNRTCVNKIYLYKWNPCLSFLSLSPKKLKYAKVKYLCILYTHHLNRSVSVSVMVSDTPLRVQICAW